MGVEERPGLVRMEVVSHDIPSDLSEDGVSGSGHLCLEGVSPAGTILQLETRPRVSSNGCLPSGLESDFPVRIPAILFNNSRAQSSANSKGKQDDTNRTNMAVTTVVPTAVVHGHNDAIIPRSTHQTVVKSQGPNTPFIAKLLSEPSGLASLRDRLRAEGVSEGVINIMLHSRRQGTTKSYESAWKNWRLWCGRRGVDPTRYSVMDGLDYAADLFQKGRHKSAQISHFCI